MQASILSTDTAILSFIGAILITILGIAGYFIDHWIKNTEQREMSREDSSQKREDAMNVILQTLNDTLSDVNTNLKVYQASMDGTLSNIQDKTKRNSEYIDKQGKHIQDHEIRLTVMERVKI